MTKRLKKIGKTEHLKNKIKHIPKKKRNDAKTCR